MCYYICTNFYKKDKAMTHVNEGHRQRLRERMLKDGLDGFKDHELLELLLFQSVPRKDTNKLAHTLIASFGSLYNVLNAQPDELMLVKGVSQITACNIAMLKEVWRRYTRGKQEKEKRDLSSVKDIMRFAQLMIAESYAERVVVVYVDRGTKFLFSTEYAADTDAHEVHLDVKKIISDAVRIKAGGIMLFHCHTEGDCKPSTSDVRFTQKLIYALGGLEIVLLEHVIFAPNGEYYSFLQEGDLDRIANEYKTKLKNDTRLD